MEHGNACSPLHHSPSPQAAHTVSCVTLHGCSIRMPCSQLGVQFRACCPSHHRGSLAAHCAHCASELAVHAETVTCPSPQLRHATLDVPSHHMPSAHASHTVSVVVVHACTVAVPASHCLHAVRTTPSLQNHPAPANNPNQDSTNTHKNTQSVPNVS